MGALRRSTAPITAAVAGQPAAVPAACARVPALLAAGAAALAALGVGRAAAQDPPPLTRSPLLWATVNVCDTVDHPDTIGIRGSMPGSAVSREQMFMRLQLEYRSAPDGAWRSIGAAGDSGWIPVGSGKYRQRQSGRNFTVRPPRTGASTLRGAVRFEWRRDGRVTAHALRRTSAGHPPTAGADPPGYSAATCDVRA